MLSGRPGQRTCNSEAVDTVLAWQQPIVTVDLSGRKEWNKRQCQKFLLLKTWCVFLKSWDDLAQFMVYHWFDDVLMITLCLFRWIWKGSGNSPDKSRLSRLSRLGASRNGLIFWFKHQPTGFFFGISRDFSWDFIWELYIIVFFKRHPESTIVVGDFIPFFFGTIVTPDLCHMLKTTQILSSEIGESLMRSVNPRESTVTSSFQNNWLVINGG